MKQVDYINARVKGEAVDTPRFLYKYRPFDEHTFDMLENGYVFLCAAERLDDPSECSVDLSNKDLYEMRSDVIKFKCIERLLEMIRPHTSKENFQLASHVIFRCVTPQGEVRRNFLLDDILSLQERMPYVDWVALINFLSNIPERLDKPQTKAYFEALFSAAYSARSKMGICSLSEIKDSQIMWEKYADQSKGYCVEYDMQGYNDLELLYPVVYQDVRENHVVTCILGAFIGQMVHDISYGSVEFDASQYMRLFLTKDMIWEYQKEWRLLGAAGQKLRAPTIRTIYMGKQASAIDKIRMTEFCRKKNIAVR